MICKSYLVARTHVKIKDHKWQYCIGGEICLFYITSCPWNPPGWRRLSKDPPTSRSHAASVTLQSYIRARGASNSTTSPVTTSLSPLVRQAAGVEVASHFRFFLPHEISSRKVCASLSWFTAINIKQKNFMMFACLKVVKNESVICSELCFIGLCNQAWNCIFCNAVFGSETKLLLNYAMPSLPPWLTGPCVMDGLTDGDDRNSSLADGHAERASHAWLGRENCRAVFSRQLAKLACQARPECSWADEWLYLVLGCGRRADLLSFHFHCISKICGKNMLRTLL